jgi:hypothetical protein
MSRGPGRIQRAILDMIATPEAMATCDLPGNEQVGPVGVPVDAVFAAVYGSRHATRAQRVAVFRAIRVLTARGLVDIYGRRVCPRSGKVAAWVPPSECCGYSHVTENAVGRPRTDDERAAKEKRHAEAMAMLKALR